MNINQTYNDAVLLYEQGNYEDAAKLFQYIMKDCENLSAARSYGCCLTRLGEYDKAISLFKRLIESCPNWESLWYNLGYAYLKNDNMKQALSCFLKAEEIEPEDVSVLFYLGLYYEKTDNYEKAIEYYKRSLVIENCFQVNASLAVCYYAVEDFEEALKYAKEAYYLSPNIIDNLFYYTRLLVKNKKYQEGFYVFNSTELNYDADAELLITYIICSLRTGNVKNADAAYIKLKKIDAESTMVCDYEKIRNSFINKN